MRRLLGRLLHLANASPPNQRAAFYALKDRLLARWGTRDGHDVQEIVKECWGSLTYLDGYGVGVNGCPGRGCHKCGGTGVFARKITYLLRWKLGGYSFHTIGWGLAAGPPTIRGRVRHANYGRKSEEAALWLFLLFDRKAFWKEFTGSYFYGWYLLPMVNLQRHVGWRLGRTCDRLKKRTCWCGRTYRLWFAGLGWQCCGRCRKPHNPFVEDLNEIPF